MGLVLHPLPSIPQLPLWLLRKSCIDIGMYRGDRRERRRARWQRAAERARHISTSETDDRPSTSCRRCTDCPGTSYHSSAGSWTAYQDVPPTCPATEEPCWTCAQRQTITTDPQPPVKNGASTTQAYRTVKMFHNDSSRMTTNMIQVSPSSA